MSVADKRVLALGALPVIKETAPPGRIKSAKLWANQRRRSSSLPRLWGSSAPCRSLWGTAA